MRLVQKAAILEIRHHVANRCSAQGFFKALGDGARRDWLAGLDIRPDKVRQNLPVTPFLERCVSHSSTHVWRVLTTIVGSLSSPGQSSHAMGFRIWSAAGNAPAGIDQHCGGKLCPNIIRQMDRDAL